MGRVTGRNDTIMKNLLKIIAYSVVGLVYIALAPSQALPMVWDATGLTLIGLAITLLIDAIIELAFKNKVTKSEHQQLLAELTAIRAELAELRTNAALPQASSLIPDQTLVTTTKDTAS